MEAGQQVNEGQAWVGVGRVGGVGRKQYAETTRPHSALSMSSSSYTVSSASLPRSSPFLPSSPLPSSPVPSSSPTASSYGDANERTNRTPSPEKGRRPNSASGMETAEVGLFRRSKSTPSLQAEEDENGRRSLWGWGQRPLLPPPHFYYCPHQPPRNVELRDADIPEGVDRVKRMKERIEKESPRVSPTEETADNNGSTHDNIEIRRQQSEGPNATSLPFRTPSFGGSMIQLHLKSTTLPLRGVKIPGNRLPAIPKNAQISPTTSPSWRSTIPRDAVSTMYWNGLSTIAPGGKIRVSPEKGSHSKSSGQTVGLPGVGADPSGVNGELRVSTSTLERLRARGSSVTYYGGRVVKQGSPADPTHVIMEEIRRQRESEGGAGFMAVVQDLSGALKALGKDEVDWVEGRGKQDSSYGSAESTPVGTPAPSMAPTPPPPPSPRPLSPSSAKVVSTIAKKGGVSTGEQQLQPSWSGKCSVVFDFRRGKGSEGWEGERGRDGLWEEGRGVCF